MANRCGPACRWLTTQEESCELSLSEIGKLFRNRDHTTVRHACHKIRTQLSTDDGHIRDTIASICQALQIDLPSSCLTDQRDECA